MSAAIRNPLPLWGLYFLLLVAMFATPLSNLSFLLWIIAPLLALTIRNSARKEGLEDDAQHASWIMGSAGLFLLLVFLLIGGMATASSTLIGAESQQRINEISTAMSRQQMPWKDAFVQLLEVQPNGDSVWTFSFGYICRNLPATLKLLLRTLPEQGALWLQGLLGTSLGEPIVYRIDVSWLLGVGLVLALLAAALPTAESAPLGRRMAWGTAGILACVALAVLAAALNWTPINYQTLFGMQGRYLLPVLPLALLLLRAQHLVALRRSAAHGAALAVALLTLLTQLQGFALYAAWQPVS